MGKGQGTVRLLTWQAIGEAVLSVSPEKCDQGWGAADLAGKRGAGWTSREGAGGEAQQS